MGREELPKQNSLVKDAVMTQQSKGLFQARSLNYLMAFLFVAALVAPQAITASPAKSKTKIPKASSQFKAAMKSLAKQKNYKVKASVLGGLSTTKDHKVSSTTTRENYLGKCAGSYKKPLMEIPSIKAYKTPKAGKGVILNQGLWKGILTSQKGVKMDRLIDFPYLIMAEAARYSKNARWLEKDEVPDGFTHSKKGDKESPKKKTKSSSKKDKKGSTSVKKTDSDADEEEVEIPRVLRIEASPKSALTTWIKRVENSGCMSEG